jgi:acyl carrier protein
MALADEVSGIIAKNLKMDPAKVKPTTRLSELSADSLDVLEIVFVLEEKYDINLAFEAKENSYEVKVQRDGQVKTIEFSTVGDIIEAVRQVIEAQGQLAGG